MQSVNGAGTASGGTILLVEDDDQVRGFVRSVLANAGYRVLEAGTGLEGLELGNKHQGQIDLLVSDMLLPELSGYDVAERLRAVHPELKVLFMTGYVEGDIVRRSVTEFEAAFLDKPFSPSVLLQKVREAIPTERSGTPR